MSTLQGTASVRTPIKFAHVVYRTNNFAAMRDFYLNFLNAKVAFEEPDKIAFLRYDDEHHRVGIIGMPDIDDKVKKSNGLEHVAFTYPSLPALIMAYKERKEFGMQPFWCINHGPTLSMYYHDADGNTVETQWDALDVEEADYFMISESYRENPIGAEFDPEELLGKIERGEDISEYTKRKNVGKRGMDSVPK